MKRKKTEEKKPLPTKRELTEEETAEVGGGSDSWHTHWTEWSKWN